MWDLVSSSRNCNFFSYSLQDICFEGETTMPGIPLTLSTLNLFIYDLLEVFCALKPHGK